MSTQLATIETTIAAIDTFAAEQNLALLAGDTGAFGTALKIAGAIKQLREMLTEPIVLAIMELQGTKLGFRTDKDKTGGYEPIVVRDVLIEMTLKGGFMPHSNEFNIIAGNGYATKEGFQGWFRRAAAKGRCTYPDVKLSAPKTTPDGAIVIASASCRVGDKLVEVKDAELPVKGQGADQILGKATRKILARLYEKVTGMSVTDGDASDAIDVQTTTVSSTTPSASPADPLDEDTARLLDELCAEHADKINDFLRKSGQIGANDTYRSVSMKTAKRMLKYPDSLFESAGVAKKK
ncbi:MAG TPA: hypothetical protein VHF69_08070 [Candidatus Synoicihabitans sp.]|nr:hypothetical protein [Candidatus Synoicihabitans sp.]